MEYIFNQFGLIALGAAFAFAIAIVYGYPKAQKMAREAWRDTAGDLEKRVHFLEKDNERLSARPDLTEHAKMLAATNLAIAQVVQAQERLVMAQTHHEEVAQNRALAQDRNQQRRHDELMELLEQRLGIRNPDTRERSTDETQGN